MRSKAVPQILITSLLQHFWDWPNGYFLQDDFKKQNEFFAVNTGKQNVTTKQKQNNMNENGIYKTLGLITQKLCGSEELMFGPCDLLLYIYQIFELPFTINSTFLPRF